MGRKTKNLTSLPEPPRPEPRMPRGSQVVIAASVPIYFGLAWLLAILLPDYCFVAWVPLAFGIHSVTILLFSWSDKHGSNSWPDASKDE